MPRSSGVEENDRHGQQCQEFAASSSGTLLSPPSWRIHQRNIPRTGAIVPALICLLAASSSSLTSPLERHCAAAPPPPPSCLSSRCSQPAFSSGAGQRGGLRCEVVHPAAMRGRGSPGLVRLRGGMESLHEESEFGELLADLDEEVSVWGLAFRVQGLGFKGASRSRSVLEEACFGTGMCRHCLRVRIQHEP